MAGTAPGEDHEVWKPHDHRRVVPAPVSPRPWRVGQIPAVQGTINRLRKGPGPDGLLKRFTKNVLETALNEEITEHLGYEKNRAEPGREPGNVRNGARAKTVISDAVGEVRIDVPRDREGTFEPQIVKKRQRRLTEVDEIVLSLYAKGLTTGEISAHFAEIYGASISRETVSRITEKVVAEMAEWASRPLDAVYVAVFIDRGQGPGRPGGQPARLRRHRRHRGRPQGRAGPVGWHRR
jgi:hypothetical protein